MREKHLARILNQLEIGTAHRGDCERAAVRIRLSGKAILLSALLISLVPGCSQERDKGGGPETSAVELEPGEVAPAVPESVKPGPSATREETRLIVLEDSRCTDRKCQTAPAITKLRGILPGLAVVRHDWSEEQCKTLFDSEGLTYLPAFLFEPSIEKSPGYPAIARYLTKTPKGQLELLATGASFDPRAEICDNGKDDTGDGQVDCQDPTCSGKVVCREEIPRRLDLFVMSMCPFGTMAMDSMSELLEAFDGNIDFHIHYIANETETGFRSLHGQPEVDENIRELCAMEHFPRDYQYMEYIWCRNRNIRDQQWKNCTGNKGIDVEVIEKCSEGEEGNRLLRENLELAEQLGIGASPTWLANNRFQFSGIAPEAVKQSFCKHNPGLEGCEKKLSTETPKPAGACG